MRGLALTHSFLPFIPEIQIRYLYFIAFNRVYFIVDFIETQNIKSINQYQLAISSDSELIY